MLKKMKLEKERQMFRENRRVQKIMKISFSMKIKTIIKYNEAA